MRVRIMLVVALMVAVAFAASAQMHAGAGQAAGNADVEEIELTGRLRLERDQLPVLTVDGREYTLRIAPALSAEFEVRNGQEVSVSGFLLERPSRDLLGTTSIVMVRAIEVGGTRYVMPMQVMRHMRRAVQPQSRPAPGPVPPRRR